jgi:hypothetical protein
VLFGEEARELAWHAAPVPRRQSKVMPGRISRQNRTFLPLVLGKLQGTVNTRAGATGRPRK